ncbi:rhomboid family intramembrane serine protease [uncultured Kordia sp.]|uniref:rhomboid family intramembrane serine protease n=1 Tax=uncultured Kordia sp. TaxID=507699 RepID=UPI00262D33C4|nr:rhomboid family intramembrane serine protease [uncultured Kordia sp.]
MDWKTRIATLYRGFNIAEKLIFLNIVVFAIVSLYNMLFYSFTGTYSTFFTNYFTLPKALGELLYKPWTIVTYGFMHADFMHLIFNCIGLYFTGRIFSTFFSERQFITVYSFGIFAGALLFLVSYNLLPAFADKPALLMGASAAVLAITVAGATYSPNLIVNLLGIFPIKYWIVAALLVVSYVSYIPYTNAGGHFAHIGGALIGYLYVKQLQSGKNIGTGFENLLDSLASFFKFKKKSPLKTVYKNKKTKTRSSRKTASQSPTEKQHKIDGILDKISKSGYESLTKEEKDFLFKAGKEN